MAHVLTAVQVITGLRTWQDRLRAKNSEQPNPLAPILLNDIDAMTTALENAEQVATVKYESGPIDVEEEIRKAEALVTTLQLLESAYDTDEMDIVPTGVEGEEHYIGCVVANLIDRLTEHTIMSGLPQVGVKIIVLGLPVK